MAALVAEGQAHPLNSKPSCNEMMHIAKMAVDFAYALHHLGVICKPAGKPTGRGMAMWHDSRQKSGLTKWTAVDQVGGPPSASTITTGDDNTDV